MKISPSTFVHAATALAFAALSGQAAAVNTCTTLSNNGVSVEECSTGPNSGTYSVTNTNGQEIGWFAVSTDAADAPAASTSRLYWSAQYLTEEQWNDWYSRDYRSFDERFGTHDTGVFMYRGMMNYIGNGQSTGEQFFFDASPSSNMVAGGANGIFAQSYSPTAAIPEPSTYALMGLGLMGLGAAVRRQRKAA